MSQTAFLAIQCRTIDGSKGTFLFTGESTARKPISPVFSGCVELFDWAKANGWSQAPHDPAHPVGVYTRGEG
jgi:hypothetical protein